MSFGHGPLIGAFLVESHFAETLREIRGSLRHGYRRLFSFRCTIHRRDCELEAVVGCPGAADQILQNLDLALARLAVGVRELGGLHQVAVSISHQVALAVVNHHDRHGFVGIGIGNTVNGLALVRFADGPLIRSRFGEGHLAKAGRITGGVLCHGCLVVRKGRSIAHRRDGELETVIRRPGTSDQGLLDLDFPFATLAVGVRERGSLHQRAALFGHQVTLAVVDHLDGHSLVFTVIGNTVNGLALVRFGHGPLIGAGLGEGHFAEAGRIAFGFLRHGHSCRIERRSIVLGCNREFEAVVCRPGTAAQGFLDLDLPFAALAVGIRERSGLYQIAGFGRYQVALAVIHDNDGHGLVRAVIGNTVNGLALVRFGHGPLIGTGFGEGHRAEALRIVRGILRDRCSVVGERRSVAHGRDLKLETVVCRPVTAAQGLLHLDFARSGLAVGVREGGGLHQRAAGVGHQVALAVVDHLDGHSPVFLIIGYALDGLALMRFTDGPGILSGLREGHFTEAGRITGGILRDGYRVVRKRRSLGVCRRNRELKAVACCPVAAAQGLLDLDLALAALVVGVREFCRLEQGAAFFSNQMALAVVLDNDGHGPVRTVIGDAINGVALMGFCHGPLIRARFGEGHLAEALRVVRGVLRDGYLVVRECQRVVAHRRNRELELVAGRPFTAGKVLLHLDFAFAALAVSIRERSSLHQSAVGIGHEAALAVVDHLDGHGLRRAVVGYTVDLITGMLLCNGPLIGARFFEGHFAEAGRIAFGVLCHGHGIGGECRSIALGRNREFEAVVAGPGTAAQGLLGLDFPFAALAVGIRERSGLHQIAGFGRYQVALAVIHDNDGHGLVRAVIGNTVNGLALVRFGHGPLIGTGFGEGHRAEALRIVRGILRDRCSVVGERRSVAHGRDLKLETVVCRPVTAAQGLLHLDFARSGLAVGVREGGGLHQRAAGVGHQVALAVVDHLDGHSPVFLIIGYALDGLALMRFTDGPGILSGLREGHFTEAGRITGGILRDGYRVVRKRRSLGVCRRNRELKAVACCPVAAAQGLLDLDLALAALVVGVREFCRLEQGAAFFSNQMALAVVLDNDGHGPVRTVIGDAINGVALMGFCHGPLIRARFGEGHLAEALRVVRGVLRDGYLVVRECQRVVAHRRNRELELVAGRPFTAGKVLLHLDFAFAALAVSIRERSSLYQVAVSIGHQMPLAVVHHLDGHNLVFTVIGNTVNGFALMGFCHLPLIGAFLVKGHLAEALGIIRGILCYRYGVLSECRGSAHGFDREGKAVIRRPVTAAQGLLNLDFAFTALAVGVRERGGLDQCAAFLGYQVALTVIHDLNGHGLIGAVIGDAVNGFTLMSFGHGPLIGSGLSEGHLAKALGITRGILRHGHSRGTECRGIALGRNCELEAVICRPVTSAQGLLDFDLPFAALAVGIRERGGLHQRAVLGSYQVAFPVIHHRDGHGLVGAVIGNTVNRLALVRFGNGPFVCTGFREGHGTEALGVIRRILCHGYSRGVEYRRIAHRRNRELKAVVRRPGASVQSLPDLHFAFAGCAVIIRERSSLHQRTVGVGHQMALAVIHNLDGHGFGIIRIGNAFDGLAMMRFNDVPCVGAGFSKCHGAEAFRIVRGILRHIHLVVRKRGSLIIRRRNCELEAVARCPVTADQGLLNLHLARSGLAVIVRERSGLHQGASGIGYQVALAVVLDNDGYGLVGRVIGNPFNGLALMRFMDGPLIGSCLGEGHRAEAFSVVHGILRHIHGRGAERRSRADRRNRELEAVVRCPVAADQVLLNLYLARSGLAVIIRERSGLHQGTVGIGYQVALAVVLDNDGDCLVSAVIFDTADGFALMCFTDGPLIDPRLGEGHRAEAGGIVRGLIVDCHLVRRKCRSSTDRRNCELEAVIRRPVAADQVLLNLHFARSGLAVIVRERCGLHQRTAGIGYQMSLAVILDNDGYSLVRAVIGDAVKLLPLVRFTDGPCIGPRLGEGHRAEAGGIVRSLIVNCYLVRRKCRSRADRRNRELEAVVRCPVAADQVLLNLYLARSGLAVIIRERSGLHQGTVGIGYQVALAVVLDNDGDCLVSAVIFDTADGFALMCFTDGPLIDPRLGEGHRAEAGGIVRGLIVDCHLVRRKCRSSTDRRNCELEAVIRRPVAADQVLLNLHFARSGLAVIVRERCGLHQRAAGIGHQVALPVVLDNDRYGLVRTVIVDTADGFALMRFTDGPLIGARLGEGNATKAARMISRRAVNRHRIRRKRRSAADRRNRELEAVVRRPVAADQVLLNLHFARSGLTVGVLKFSGLHQRAAGIGHQVTLPAILDNDRHSPGSALVGNAADGLAGMFFRHGPLIGAGLTEGHRAEALGIAGSILINGQRVRRKRRSIADRFDRECKAVIGRPGTAAQGLLDLDFARSGGTVVVLKRSSLYQRAVGIGNQVAFPVVHNLDGHGLVGAVIGDAVKLLPLMRFADSPLVGSLFRKDHRTEALGMVGRILVNGQGVRRKGRSIAHRGDGELKAVICRPVAADQGLLNLDFTGTGLAVGVCERSGLHQRAGGIRIQCAVAVVLHDNRHGLRSAVVRHTLDLVAGMFFRHGPLIGTCCCEGHIAEAGGMICSILVNGQRVRRECRSVAHRCNREGEAVVGRPGGPIVQGLLDFDFAFNILVVVRKLSDNRFAPRLSGNNGYLDALGNRRHTGRRGIGLFDPVVTAVQAGHFIAVSGCAVIADRNRHSLRLSVNRVRLCAVFIQIDGEGIGSGQLALCSVGNRFTAVIQQLLVYLQAALANLRVGNSVFIMMLVIRVANNRNTRGITIDRSFLNRILIEFAV